MWPKGVLVSVRVWLIDYSCADAKVMRSNTDFGLRNHFELPAGLSSEVQLQNYVRDISLRYILSQEYRIPVEDWSFVKSKLGKPSILNLGFEDLKFSVSHSGKHLAIILASGSSDVITDVGIDIEPISRSDQAAKLKQEFLSEVELSAINRLNNSEGARLVLNHWTLKEAISKAVGLGLSLPFHSFSIKFLDSNTPQLFSITKQTEYNTADFFLKSCEPKLGIQLAYCVYGKKYVDQGPPILNLNFSEVLRNFTWGPSTQYA